MTKNDKELSKMIKMYIFMYMLVCIYFEKITLLDNAIELNSFYVASLLYFSYSIKCLCQVQMF